jgi:hypothetical protein
MKYVNWRELNDAMQAQAGDFLDWQWHRDLDGRVQERMQDLDLAELFDAAPHVPKYVAAHAAVTRDAVAETAEYEVGRNPDSSRTRQLTEMAKLITEATRWYETAAGEDTRKHQQDANLTVRASMPGLTVPVPTDPAQSPAAVARATEKLRDAYEARGALRELRERGSNVPASEVAREYDSAAERIQSGITKVPPRSTLQGTAKQLADRAAESAMFHALWSEPSPVGAPSVTADQARVVSTAALGMVSTTGLGTHGSSGAIRDKPIKNNLNGANVVDALHAQMLNHHTHPTPSIGGAFRFAAPEVGRTVDKGLHKDH